MTPNVQEFKAQQSRHSSLSPHGWLDPEEEQELDSDGSDDEEEEYYNQQYGRAIDGCDLVGRWFYILTVVFFYQA